MTTRLHLNVSITALIERFNKRIIYSIYIVATVALLAGIYINCVLLQMDVKPMTLAPPSQPTSVTSKKPISEKEMPKKASQTRDTTTSTPHSIATLQNSKFGARGLYFTGPTNQARGENPEIARRAATPTMRRLFSEIYRSLKLSPEQIDSFEDAVGSKIPNVEDYEKMLAMKVDPTRTEAAAENILNQLEARLNRSFGSNIPVDLIEKFQAALRTSEISKIVDDVANTSIAVNEPLTLIQEAQIESIMIKSGGSAQVDKALHVSDINWSVVLREASMILSQQQMDALRATQVKQGAAAELGLRTEVKTIPVESFDKNHK